MRRVKQEGTTTMELWDAYFPDGTLSGETLVRGEPIPPEYRHAVAEVLVMHQDDTILLMQRDWRKPNQPGMWESSAGGSVLQGEDFESCARRELLEETGLTADSWEYLYTNVTDDTIYQGYLAVTSADKDSVTLQEGETISYRWVTGPEWLDVLQSGMCGSNTRGQLDELIRRRIIKPRKWRLLLFDLDGTLLRSDKTISNVTLKALEDCRNAGMLIGVCTARSEENAWSFIQELDPDVLITSGGALVKYKGEYIYRSEFSVEETNKIIKTARTVCGPDCEITIDTVEHHYWNYRIDPKTIDPSWGNSIYTDFSDFRECSLKVCVEIIEDSKAKRLQELLNQCDCVRFSDGNWYKFTKCGTTKENAIMEVCSKCGITAQEIMAFGDDYSDVEMLKLCGRGIAMGNSIASVKDIADQVIGTNDEDGIATYINSILTAELV